MGRRKEVSRKGRREKGRRKGGGRKRRREEMEEGRRERSQEVGTLKYLASFKGLTHSTSPPSTGREGQLRIDTQVCTVWV